MVADAAGRQACDGHAMTGGIARGSLPEVPHRSSRRNKRPLNDDPLANGRGQTSQGMGRRNA
ncbi:uncharacterized protein K441DRAFT_663094 [Cenococcum geophilum 1.58]|uniref:uncharacterized protein n=1 Tax=Cenococcum geophilum 1.58 TaxID=794803 RepID=UPI00358DFE29|nr:hypothetical protein K441DRAFT_663094 [Cenococcum geophilum 1.58]